MAKHDIKQRNPYSASPYKINSGGSHVSSCAMPKSSLCRTYKGCATDTTSLFYFKVENRFEYTFMRRQIIALQKEIQELENLV